MADSVSPEQNPTGGPYTGKDLNSSKKQVRLIDLQPGSGNDPLVCKSRVVSLAPGSGSFPYTALSYCWGNSKDQLPIYFNNCSHRVTRNLHIALEHLRDKDEVVTLWVDALCINQVDEAEKHHQIQLMDDIYRQATRTCIWLGEESHKSDLAMDLIKRLDGDDFGSINNSPDDEGLRAILHLQHRPWWSRVWVIQEAILSPKPHIRCGNKVLPVEAFMRLDDIRRGWHRGSGRWQRSSSAIAKLSQSLWNPFTLILTDWPETRDNVKVASKRDTLSSWAQSTIHFEATDPKDKIYGVLGLVPKNDKKHMQVALNQRMTAAQVYVHATRRFIQADRSLIHLSFDTDSRAKCVNGEALPSWVPDYSYQPPETADGSWFRPQYVSLDTGSGNYGATGDGSLLPASIAGNPFYLNIPVPALSLRGLVVDRVAFASGNPPIRPYNGADVETRMRISLDRLRMAANKVRAWGEEAMKPGRPHPYSYGAKQTRQEAFRRTLTANGWGSSRYSNGQSSDPLSESRLNYEAGRWDQLFDVFLGRCEIPFHYGYDKGSTRAREEALLQFLLPLREALLGRISGRSFIITSEGYLGLAPRSTLPGDLVCVLEGGTVPFVLRPVGNGELASCGIKPGENQHFFTLVGESYVLGVSDGEWISYEDRKKDDVLEVVII